MDDARLQSARPAEIAVCVERLSLERGGKELFREMRWELPKGSFLAVTGPSGAGKSSLLACLRGTVPALAGRYDLLAEPRRVGVVFQHLRLSPNLDVLTNVLCGKLGKYPWWRTLFHFPADDRSAAYGILSELGLADLVHKPARSISGGEQQRTAVARVLLQDPEVILADEPTSDLDPKLAELVLARLKQLCSENRTTVICVLHNSEMVDKFADMELRIGMGMGNNWDFRHIGEKAQI
jgi:phosphonate transport system ATP-binding protein